MNYFTGGAVASVISQLEIPPEVVNLGAVGIVAFAAAIIALALVALVRTGAPLLRLLSEQFIAMKDSNAALLKRLEASDAVIERNTVAHTANAAALDRVASDSQRSASEIHADVSKLSAVVERQIVELKEHITTTGEENKDAIIEVISAALPILEDIRQQSKDAAAKSIEQHNAILNRVDETEKALIAAMSKLTPPTKQTTETAVVAVTKKIETGRLPSVTELVKPTEPKDPAA